MATRAVGGDFLGPGETVVEDVAREELGEDRERHGPEQRHGRPVLEGVTGKIDGGNGLRLDGARQLVGVDLGVDFRRHGVLPPYGQSVRAGHGPDGGEPDPGRPKAWNEVEKGRVKQTVG